MGQMRRCIGSALFGLSILSLSAVGQDKTTQSIILRAEPPDREVLPNEVEIRIEGKRLSTLIRAPSAVAGQSHPRAS